MYLQREIEDALWGAFPMLSETLDPSKQVAILTPVLAQFGANIRLARASSYRWILKGFYDPNRDDICIYLARGANRAHPSFLFELNCTVQHELIHKWQWLRRDIGVHAPRKHLPRDQYLACYDEIETQAHDLAMEIKYYYPGMNPTLVLHKYFSGKEVHLPTLNSYMRAFDSDVAHPAMRRLFRKLFLWLPKVEIQRPVTFLQGGLYDPG